MSPAKTHAVILNTSADLAAITSEISKSVAGEGGQSKRAKHVEKAKVQQVTKQLAMRLQYAKLKVDHGWTRQNLNEVENLYFHHYTRRQPSTHTSYTLRVPVAGRFKTNAPVAGPSASKGTSTPPIGSSQTSAQELGEPQSSQADTAAPPASSSAAASSSSNQLRASDPSSSQLRQPSSSQTTQAARQAARPTPYPTSAFSASAASSSNVPTPPRAAGLPRQTSYPPSALGASVASSSNPPIPPRPAIISPPLADPTSRPSPYSPYPPSRSTVKVTTTKTQRPSNATAPIYPPPRLTKTQNKTTSTPSTLKPPVTETAYKSPALLKLAGIGNNLQSKGPTSYESFWSSLGSGSGLGMTNATATAKLAGATAAVNGRVGSLAKTAPLNGASAVGGPSSSNSTPTRLTSSQPSATASQPKAGGTNPSSVVRSSTTPLLSVTAPVPRSSSSMYLAQGDSGTKSTTFLPVPPPRPKGSSPSLTGNPISSSLTTNFASSSSTMLLPPPSYPTAS